MLKEDKKILSYLTPYSDNKHLVDTYFMATYFKGKDTNMYTLLDKTKTWVEKNGGCFEKLSNKIIIGEKKGFLVKIVYPCFGERDMKNIMATLYYQQN